jgi:hypothetical protein
MSEEATGLHRNFYENICWSGESPNGKKILKLMAFGIDL